MQIRVAECCLTGGCVSLGFDAKREATAGAGAIAAGGLLPTRAASGVAGDIGR
jgi:hypothetical protein